MKIVVIIMGADHERYLDMCLDSVKDADQIIYVDGGSKDNSVKLALDKDAKVLQRHYNHKLKTGNSDERNFYLDHLKKNYKGWWCLVLDADEIVDDFSKIRKFMECSAEDKNLYSIRMRHFIYNFRFEDATAETHYVGNRLFIIREGLKYPKGEHVILKDVRARENKTVYMRTNCTTIWHLAYSRLFHILDRYKKNVKYSNVHDKGWLRRWYFSHLFGEYLVKEVNLLDLPRVLLDGFGISRDELYFRDRGVQLQHWQDAADWKRFFKPEKVLEVGCGLGPRVHCMNAVGLDAWGVELSKWAVENSLAPEAVARGDVCKLNIPAGWYDLVVAYDVLEHLDYKDLEKAIDNLIRVSGRFILVSVPFLGDPNLLRDPTHKIKEDRDWWVKQFVEAGLREIKVPKHFLFKDQLLIFEKPDGVCHEVS
jgi:glycosyltransferase involved in cell wall biosynthesis